MCLTRSSTASGSKMVLLVSQGCEECIHMVYIQIKNAKLGMFVFF